MILESINKNNVIKEEKKGIDLKKDKILENEKDKKGQCCDK